jgi:hypothetical protein
LLAIGIDDAQLGRPDSTVDSCCISANFCSSSVCHDRLGGYSLSTPVGNNASIAPAHYTSKGIQGQMQSETSSFKEKRLRIE